MSRIIRTSQPQSVVEIDWTNPITVGLTYSVDLGTDLRPVKVGTSIAVNSKGLTRSFSAALDKVTGPTYKFGTQATFVAVVMVRTAGVGTNFGKIFYANNQEILGCNSSATSWNYLPPYTGGQFWTITTPAANVPYVIGISRTDTNAIFRIDGRTPTVSGGSITGTLSTSTVINYLGNNNTGDRGLDGTLSLFLQWNRALSANELSSITLNPWQIFHPIKRPVFYGASGAVSHPTTGDLAAQSAIITGTSGVVHKHPSTGAFAAQSAVITGTSGVVHKHPSTGALAAQSAVITGTATVAAPAGVHPCTGNLAAADAIIVGSATVVHKHATSGDLVAQSALISGLSTRTSPSSGTSRLKYWNGSSWAS